MNGSVHQDKSHVENRGTERAKEKPHLEEKVLVSGENPTENKREDKAEGRARQSERETERVELMKAQGKRQKNKK